MKKTLFYMLIAVLLGTISGKVLYSKYENTTLVFNEKKLVYFIQEGVYESRESLMRNTKDIYPKLVINKKNKYYVYVGLTRTTEGVEKIKKVYKKKGYNVISKELEINDDSFIINLDQYDILLKSATSTNDILTIEEVVLSNYEESIK